MTADQDELIGVRLSVHNKALEALFKAESAYREELERRRMLIPLGKAMEIARHNEVDRAKTIFKNEDADDIATSSLSTPPSEERRR